MLPLVAGHFDFSVGAVAASASVVCAGLMQDTRAPLSVAMLAALGVGLAVGLANGVAVAYLQVNAFVSTLAVATLLGGGSSSGTPAARRSATTSPTRW